MDFIIGCFLFFSLGYVVGKILAKMHSFCLLFCSLMMMPVIYNHPAKNLLIASTAFILGVARGYKLFPIFCEMLEEYRVSIQLFFAKRQNLSYSTAKDDWKKQEHRNRMKAEELRQKEQELYRQAEEIKRQKQRTDEELRKARDKQAKNTKYPNSLQEAFEVLGTRSGLRLEEYKKIWKQEVMKYHPDRTAGLGERLQKQAEEEMKAINRAWEIIKKKV